MVPFRYSRTRAFSDRLFYLDFTNALHQLERDRPLVDERRRWWLALAEADRKDIARYVAFMNAQGDVDYYARQNTTIGPKLGEISTLELLKVNGRVATLEPPRRTDHDKYGPQKRTRDFRDYAPYG